MKIKFAENYYIPIIMSQINTNDRNILRDGHLSPMFIESHCKSVSAYVTCKIQYEQFASDHSAHISISTQV